jgi:hypothetical protein
MNDTGENFLRVVVSLRFSLVETDGTEKDSRGERILAAVQEDSLGSRCG